MQYRQKACDADPIIDLMLDQRRRRWAKNKSTLDQRLSSVCWVFVENAAAAVVTDEDRCTALGTTIAKE